MRSLTIFLNKEFLLKICFAIVIGVMVYFIFQSILISAILSLISLYLFKKSENFAKKFLSTDDNFNSLENFKLRSIRFSEIDIEKEIAP